MDFDCNIFLTALFVIAWFLILRLYSKPNKQIKKSVTVMSHSIAVDRYGDRTYCTVLKSDDGCVYEWTGLQTYVLPIGSITTITVYH